MTKSLHVVREQPAATHERGHHGFSKIRKPATLKSSQAALVASVGGLERAADLIGRGKSQVHRCTDEEFPDQHLSVDAIRRLMLGGGSAVVLEFLALETGYLLTPTYVAGPADLGREMAGVGQRSAELFAAYGAALTDGQTPGLVDPGEAREMKAAADMLINQLAGLRAALDVRVSQGDAK